MTDDEERLRQHWQELAEQLGIEGPAAEEKSTAKSPGVSSPSTPSPAVDEEASEIGTREEEPISSGPAAFQEPAGLTRDNEEGEESQKPPALAPGPEAPSEPSPQRRQERRSPRGTKPRRGSDQARPGETHRRDQPEETVEDPLAPRTRRRRKEAAPDHRASEDETSAEESESEEVPAVPQASDEETDKDDLDTLTDWNVPSWTELIDSLYRPDQ